MVYILLIALSLALDAFAISISTGLSVKDFRLPHALLMSAYFGVFQFIMPVIGWLLGHSVARFVANVGPWISFALLVAIGVKMIYDALRPSGSDEPPPLIALSHGRLLVLAIATSIDAFAVGVSFAFMDVKLWLSCLIIGLVTFILSMIGGLLGKKLGTRLQDHASLVGGIVLIAIGIKVLLENIL